MVCHGMIWYVCVYFSAGNSFAFAKKFSVRHFWEDCDRHGATVIQYIGMYYNTIIQYIGMYYNTIIQYIGMCNNTIIQYM